ncbi:MAG: ribokinase [Pseudonocardia sp.]
MGSDRTEGLMAGDIVVLGSVNRDVVAEVAALPGPGETVSAARMRTNVGGKGANQAVAARLLGGRVRLVARIGDDPDARPLRDALAAAGLDVSAVRMVPGHRSGAAYITVAGAENVIVVDPGANHAWPDGLGPDLDQVRDAEVLVLQQEVPAAVNELAAATTGGRVILNAAPGRPVPATLLARCDPLVVNEHELADQTDSPPGAPSGGPRRAMAALLTRGARSVVTTLGELGAAWADGDGFGTVPAVAVAAWTAPAPVMHSSVRWPRSWPPAHGCRTRCAGRSPPRPRRCGRRAPMRPTPTAGRSGRCSTNLGRVDPPLTHDRAARAARPSSRHAAW